MELIPAKFKILETAAKTLSRQVPNLVKIGQKISATLHEDLTFWRRNYFLNFSSPVYKMWIIEEQNKLDLWNKLHFEEEKTESIYHV